MYAWRMRYAHAQSGRVEPVSEMSALDRSEREDEITAWMEDRGIDNAWEISDAFVEAGVTSDDLEEVAAATTRRRRSATS